MSDVVIVGIRGRMGRSLVRLLEQDSGLRLIGGIGRTSSAAAAAGGTGAPRLADIAAAGELLADADVVIDFSTASATRQLLECCGDALAGRALVVGTTALDEATELLLDAQAERSAVLSAANFSLGVNLLAALAERAAAALPADRYDIEIIEAHHARKIDAPSGTALALGEAVARGRGRPLSELRRDGRSGDTGERPGGEIGFHAVRGGGVVGEHRLLFLGERERIELHHAALDRSLFADGALEAARWLAGREPGRYRMSDVLGIGE